MRDVSYSIPSWNSASASAPGDTFNVAIIGAGNINFGKMTSKLATGPNIH
jgi:hypothetical protein